MRRQPLEERIWRRLEGLEARLDRVICEVQALQAIERERAMNLRTCKDPSNMAALAAIYPLRHVEPGDKKS